MSCAWSRDETRALTWSMMFISRASCGERKAPFFTRCKRSSRRRVSVCGIPRASARTFAPNFWLERRASTCERSPEGDPAILEHRGKRPRDRLKKQASPRHIVCLSASASLSLSLSDLYACPQPRTDGEGYPGNCKTSTLSFLQWNSRRIKSQGNEKNNEAGEPVFNEDERNLQGHKESSEKDKKGREEQGQASVARKHAPTSREKKERERERHGEKGQEHVFYFVFLSFHRQERKTERGCRYHRESEKKI